jgi:BolA protein
MMKGAPRMRDELEERLRQTLDATHCEVIDESHLHAGHAGARDGGGHFRAVIVSERFAGLNRIKAQQLVYAAVGDWMGREIHALSMKTFTPEAWAELGGQGAGTEGTVGGTAERTVERTADETADGTAEGRRA